MARFSIATTEVWNDKSGQRHMEYLRDRGAFVEMPLATIVADFRQVYPRWLQGAGARSEPPMSEPSDSAPKPHASAAEDPPDDPPGVRARS